MGTSLIKKTYHGQLLELVHAYRESGQQWPATSRDIAVWAWNAGELQPRTSDVIKQYASEISRALREEYYIDPQGRNVRTKHAARVEVDGEQKMLWDDIRTADPAHMERSLKLRRQQIVGDCCQLKRDQDSYNDNNSYGAEIQMSLNFENDVREAELSEKVKEDATSTIRKKRPR